VDALFVTELRGGDVKLELRGHLVQEVISLRHIDNAGSYTLILGIYGLHLIQETPLQLRSCHEDDVTALALSENEDED
jgi:hypothetical protein